MSVAAAAAYLKLSSYRMRRAKKVRDDERPLEPSLTLLPGQSSGFSSSCGTLTISAGPGPSVVRAKEQECVEDKE